jgi:hypothetical protein
LELLWLVCSTWRNHEAEVLQWDFVKIARKNMKSMDSAYWCGSFWPKKKKKKTNSCSQ